MKKNLQLEDSNCCRMRVRAKKSCFFFLVVSGLEPGWTTNQQKTIESKRPCCPSVCVCVWVCVSQFKHSYLAPGEGRVPAAVLPNVVFLLSMRTKKGTWRPARVCVFSCFETLICITRLYTNIYIFIYSYIYILFCSVNPSIGCLLVAGCFRFCFVCFFFPGNASVFSLH